MIKVYGFRNTRSLRALWALEEVGAPYEYVSVDLLKGEGRKPPFIDINPSGKVPAIVNGDLVLTESAAIISYVGEQRPESGLIPFQGSRERALYDKWCFFVIGELEQPLWAIAKHCFVLPEKYRVPAMVDTAAWEFSNAARVLDMELGDKPHILGERFTGADILIGHTLAWARVVTKVPLGSERLDAYANRMLGRPAFGRARAREAAPMSSASTCEGTSE